MRGDLGSPAASEPLTVPLITAEVGLQELGSAAQQAWAYVLSFQESRKGPLTMCNEVLADKDPVENPEKGAVLLTIEAVGKDSVFLAIRKS